MRISEILKQIEEQKKTLEFIPTGFKKLDSFLDGGLLKKELVIIGADTGIGKSYFAGQILQQVAYAGFNTAYFSLEISNAMIVSRMIGALSNIKPTRITAGFLTKNELDEKTKAQAILRAHEDCIELYDDLYEFNKIEQKIRENNFELVVIDFIQNMIHGKQNMDRHESLTQMSLLLQKLAKQKNVCIIVLSQLSNTVARENNKSRPEYKGSGGIAQVADLGFFLEKDAFNDDQDFLTMNLKLAKNRRGVSGYKFSFQVKMPGGLAYES